MKSTHILLLALALSASAVYAQSEEQVLNSDPIDVDGYLKEKQVTDGELEQIRSEIRKQKNEVQLNKDKSKGYKELSKTTEKLSDVTEEYIDEKKSAQKDIADYNAKIKCLMEETPGKECDKYVRNRRQEPEVAEVQQQAEVQEVKVTQAAPAAATSVADLEVKTDLDKPFEELKLIPYAGGTQYSGDKEQLEATIAGGLKLEANLTTRFSLGFGVNYSQLKTNDFANNQYVSQSWYNSYNNQYGGREINYKSMGIDVYGKFFFTRGERFRPYIGAGLGYNRASMKYANNQNFNNASFYGQQFGNENYSNSYASGTVMLGTEVMVTRGFGLLIEGSASSGLGSSISSNSAKNIANSPDQARLNQLGNEIINATAVSIFAGGVITF
jgi:opacity protein-like surface antigen